MEPAIQYELSNETEQQRRDISIISFLRVAYSMPFKNVSGQGY